MTRRFVAVTAVVSALVACGGDGDDDSTRRTTTTAGSSTTETTTTTSPGPPDLGAVSVTLTEVAQLDQPLALAVRPDHDALFVAEKGGRVRVLRDGQVDPTPMLDISGDVSNGGEQGLLGLAFSPDGAHVYVSYTNRGGDTRVDEYAMGVGDAEVDTGSRRTVIGVDQPAANHNGGNVVFGPDGYLWLGLGDGGGGGDRYGNAQNLDTVLGDILRIDPRPDSNAAYGIPTDNPYAGGGGRPEIAIVGVRNPWRFSFDRSTGDLWVGDVGQGAWEAIDLLPAGNLLGANLGWPHLEGTHRYGSAPPDGMVAPVFEYDRSGGQSVVGGYVYRGTRIPSLQGAYLYTDTYQPTLRLLAVGDGAVVDQRTLDLSPADGGLVASFGEDADGELYVLSLSGGLYRIDPA